MPLPPIQLTHLEAVASATVVAKNLHIAASFTTGSPKCIKEGLEQRMKQLTCLLHACSIVHHCSRRFDVNGRFCILKLHALEVSDWLPELHSKGI